MAFLDLDQGWKEVRCALHILRNLCSQTIDPDGQHADLLARLQGVRRLSDVVCSVHPLMKAAGVVVSILL